MILFGIIAAFLNENDTFLGLPHQTIKLMQDVMDDSLLFLYGFTFISIYLKMGHKAQ
jgi:hypothetical protein